MLNTLPLLFIQFRYFLGQTALNLLYHQTLSLLMSLLGHAPLITSNDVLADEV